MSRKWLILTMAAALATSPALIAASSDGDTSSASSGSGKSGDDKPSDDKPGDDKGGDRKGDKPSDDKPGDDKGGDRKGDKPSDDKPGDDKGGDRKGDKPSDDKPGDDKNPNGGGNNNNNPTAPVTTQAIGLQAQGGIRGLEGKAEIRVRETQQRFKVEVESSTADDGTTFLVFVDGKAVGSLQIFAGNAKFEVETNDGKTLPAGLNPLTAIKKVTVTNSQGTVVLQGSF
jgi:uncharacterized low-complexity protein